MTPISSSSVCAAVVHYGVRERTHVVLEQLQRLHPSPGAVLVVDNGPTFGSSEWGPGIEVVSRGENAGFAGGANQAFAFASSAGFDAVWLLNNDVSLAAESLATLLVTLNGDADADVVGSAILMDGGKRTWFRGGSFSVRTGRASHRGFGEAAASADFTGAVTRTDWISGCSMLIPLRSVQIRGTFDEKLFLYKEELEWQLREPRAVALFVDSPLVIHEVGATTGTTNGKLGRGFMCRSGLILALREPGPTKLAWLGAWMIEFVAKPIVRGRFRQLNAVRFALSSRSLSGLDALAALK